MNLNIKNLGQIFTPRNIVNDMISLIKNNGNILEPSSGDGSFLNFLEEKKVTSIEYDKNLCKITNSYNIDFFNYSINNKFETIIGNPPYVRYQDINNNTKKLLFCYKNIFDNRSNLYLFFIYKSILHLKKNGEIIFITPREFLKSTSSIKLNKFIYDNGTITDIIENGDKKIFKNACPNTIIWRFEKNNFKRTISIKKKFNYNKGQLLFTKENYCINLNEIAYVKVGGVSGNDKCFENKNGINFVCSYTNKTKKLKKMLYNTNHKDLLKFKKQLLNRKIKKFNQNNWYFWGRNFYESNESRIYVNCKTRNKNPFFINNCKNYDGSIMAIFPKKKINNLEKFKNMLNNVNWEELGFIVDGRFIFNQKSLENTLLPIDFKIFL